jgi:hypothetical protein
MIKISKDEKEFLKINKLKLQSIGAKWLIQERDRIFDMPRRTSEEILERDRMIDNWHSLREFFKDIKLASEESVKETKKQDFI